MKRLPKGAKRPHEWAKIMAMVARIKHPPKAKR